MRRARSIRRAISSRSGTKCAITGLVQKSAAAMKEQSERCMVPHSPVAVCATNISLRADRDEDHHDRHPPVAAVRRRRRGASFWTRGGADRHGAAAIQPADPQAGAVLGRRSLLRTSRRVSLSPAGTELLRSAQDLIARRDHIVERVKRTASGDAGTLRIGYAASSAIGILHAIVQRVREQLPDVVLRLDDCDGADFGAAIRAGALDAAIVRAPFLTSGVVVEALHSESLVAVLPVDHPLSERDTLAPRDLADSHFILFPRAASPGLHDTIIGPCITAGFSPAIVQEAGAWLSVVSLVESGLGITIAPASTSRHCPPGVACVPIVGADKGRSSPSCMAADRCRRWFSAFERSLERRLSSKADLVRGAEPLRVIIDD